MGIVGKVILSLLVLFQTSLITSNQFSICEPKSLNYFYSNLLNCKKKTETTLCTIRHLTSSFMFFWLFHHVIKMQFLLNNWWQEREKEKNTPTNFKTFWIFFFSNYTTGNVTTEFLQTRATLCEEQFLWNIISISS